MTTLDELIKHYGTPDVIKLDTEGYELPALLGLSQKISLVWFESNLPEFFEETLGCLKQLHKLDPNAQFNFAINTTENPAVRFELAAWAPYRTMEQIVRSARYRFMEIYVRSD